MKGMNKGKNGNTSKSGKFRTPNKGKLGGPKKAISTPSYK